MTIFVKLSALSHLSSSFALVSFCLAIFLVFSFPILSIIIIRNFFCNVAIDCLECLSFFFSSDLFYVLNFGSDRDLSLPDALKDILLENTLVILLVWLVKVTFFVFYSGDLNILNSFYMLTSSGCRYKLFGKNRRSIAIYLIGHRFTDVVFCCYSEREFERDFFFISIRLRTLLYGSVGWRPSVNSLILSLASASKSSLLIIAMHSLVLAKYKCFLKNDFKFFRSIYPYFQSSIDQNAIVKSNVLLHDIYCLRLSITLLN